jgi:hypothetical protein
MEQILLKSNVLDMQKEFDSIAKDMQSPSIPFKSSIDDAIKPYGVNPAAIANSTKIAANEATMLEKRDLATRFLSLHQKAVEAITVEDINTEIARFYFRAYQLQSAEINIKSVANTIDNKSPSEEYLPFIESGIERFDSLVEESITDAYRMVTNVLKILNQRCLTLKN